MGGRGRRLERKRLGVKVQRPAHSDACPVLFTAEYERSLEESGEGGKEGVHWEAEDSSSPKMGGRCCNSYLCFD